MGRPLVDEREFIAAAVEHNCDPPAVAKATGLNVKGVQQRLKRYISAGLLTENSKAAPALVELAASKRRVKELEQRVLTDSIVRERILGLTGTPATPPPWTLDPKGKVSDLTGVPTLFCSDWHWGEVVRPAEIGGVNEYNLEIAKARAERLVTTTCELLTKHLASPRYPGICLLLGGDMISGDIHEELSLTNQEPTMVVWLDLLGVLQRSIELLHQTFGKVFVVGVTGNHGRNTHKTPMKRRNHSNFDWLLYQSLARHFKDQKGISFLIPEGSDAQFRLYNRRYLLTHGDQFRGGDGIIGPLGPITRGDIKKRSRQSQINAGYDTLLMGHWHQYINLDSLIVNGSLKGYDEYASQSNFKFESPRQALWVTHPELGITFSMPVYAERPKAATTHEWAAVLA